MSAKGNRTIAIVNAPECHQTVREAFGGTFEEINAMIDNGKLSMNGKEIKSEFLDWDVDDDVNKKKGEP